MGLKIYVGRIRIGFDLGSNVNNAQGRTGAKK